MLKDKLPTIRQLQDQDDSLAHLWSGVIALSVNIGALMTHRVVTGEASQIML